MNQLRIGFSRQLPLPRHGGYLFIGDELPNKNPVAKIFDPLKHAFNPLLRITYKKARQLADVLYAINPQGENTLTVRNGKRDLLPALLTSGRLSKISSNSEINGLISDLLTSPVLRRALDTTTDQFSFNSRKIIHARINRAELGDYDALVLGFFLIAQFSGQIVLDDLGFYGRDAHIALIREDRLIAGINHLQELPRQLRNACLLIKDKSAAGALYEDAVQLALFAGHARDTTAYSDAVKTAMDF